MISHKEGSTSMIFGKKGCHVFKDGKKAELIDFASPFIIEVKEALKVNTMSKQVFRLMNPMGVQRY